MLNKKLIVGFIVALIALVVIGFAALNFVPTNDVLDLNLTDNTNENVTENLADNVSEALNDTVITEDMINGSDVLNETNLTIDDVNATNASADGIDPGDVLHKQTFVITGNETGQYEGMEPGTYMIYYTENDGPIKIDKIG